MKHRYLKNVVTLQLNDEKCTGCGMCLNVCPHEVLGTAGKKVQIINRDACMECGACAANCPSDAITVNAGVGCATAIIKGFLAGREPACCCDKSCC